MDSTAVGEILEFLGCPPARPNLTTLRRLIDAYVRTVPWESAFRIARRSQCQGEPLPRSPEEFWAEAMQLGGGGTCFESNYAFGALLTGLGYADYLTINNMGGRVGCHTAIVVAVDGQPWLVDVGLPLHRPLHLDRDRTTVTRGAFHTYYARPVPDHRFEIERSRHPRRNAFTLIDTAVSDADYRAAASADYGAQGLFLDRVIVVRIIGNAVWRFNSSERPLRLERFDTNGARSEFLLAEETLAENVAQHFKMDVATVQRALWAVSPDAR